MSLRTNFLKVRGQLTSLDNYQGLLIALNTQRFLTVIELVLLPSLDSITAFLASAVLLLTCKAN